MKMKTGKNLRLFVVVCLLTFNVTGFLGYAGENEKGGKTAEELGDRVLEVLKGVKSLNFTAELERWWDASRSASNKGGVNKYRAEVKMGIGEIKTKVYDLKDPDSPRLIAEVKEPGDNDENIIYYDGNADGCLFGSLVNSWLEGGTAGEGLTFVAHLKRGTLSDTKTLNGRICHQIVLTRRLSNDQEEWRRLDIYYVDAENYLVRRWDSEEYEESKLTMSVKRRYRYDKGTEESAATVAAGTFYPARRRQPTDQGDK